LETGGRPLFPFFARLRIICGSGGAEEGRFAVGRHEELIPILPQLAPAGIRCSATASRLNMIEVSFLVFFFLVLHRALPDLQRMKLW
jgi:hypothetical protein